MNDQNSKPIPGIPLGALDAIEDPRVREVLRALVSTHNVRNALAGTGNEAFITIRQGLQISRSGTEDGGEASIPRQPARFAFGMGGALTAPLATIDVTLDAPADYALTAWLQTYGGSGTSVIEVKDGGGAVLLTQSDSCISGYVRSTVAGGGVTLAAGSNSLTLYAGAGSYSIGNWALLLVRVE